MVIGNSNLLSCSEPKILSALIFYSIVTNPNIRKKVLANGRITVRKLWPFIPHQGLNGSHKFRLKVYMGTQRVARNCS